MIDHHSDGFRIGRTENETENTETAIRDDILEQRVEKLGTKVTLIAILFPVLIGVIFTVAYFDIKKRVYTMQDTGVERLAKLSEELESKFSSLSVRFAGLEENLIQREKSLKNLEESFTKKIVPMEEIFLSMETATISLKDANSTLKQNMDAIEKKIEKAIAKNAGEIQAVRENAVARKEVDSRVAALDESLASLRNDFQKDTSRIEQATSLMEQMDQNVKNELKSLTEYIAKEKTRLDQAIEAIENLSGVVAQFRSEYKELAAGKGFVSEEELPLEVEKARLKLKVALDEAVMSMENRMKALERRIDTAAKATPGPTPAPGRTGGITEQNLQ